VRRHWYKPSFWFWWWTTRSRGAKAPVVIGAVALFGVGGYLAVDALPGKGWTSSRDVVTMTRIVRGEVVYRTVAGRIETLPARTTYVTVTRRSGVVTVTTRGEPVTTEITRTVTVNQRHLVTHLVVRRQTVTIQQTVTAGGRMVTSRSTVTQPVTQVFTTASTVAVTTVVPVTSTVSVTTTLPGSTVTRTVTVSTPGPTSTVVVLPTMTITLALGG